MFKHIVCPIDGSEASVQALDAAANLAAELRAQLTICTVVDPAKAAAMAFGDPGMSAACFDALDTEGRAVAHNASERIKGVCTSNCVALEGQPVSTIVDYAASSSCDLIVMGSHGRTGIPRALIGSVAEGVLRHATVPVMIIRWNGRTVPSQTSTTAMKGA